MRLFKKTQLCVLVGIVLAWSGATSLAADEIVAEPTPSIVAHIHLSGALTESPVVDPFGFTAGQMTSLADLVDLMEQMGTDDNLKALVLTYDQMSFGFGQMEEIRRSIDRLKVAGKKVYVHAEGMRTFPYALLCSADHLSVAPESALWLTGIYGESLYVKSLLDKIGVQADFLHMGAYKSAAEMLTRTSPSGPAQENIDWLFDGYYDVLVKMIAKSRQMTAVQVRELIDNGPYLADRALKEGLIDAVETREAFLARVKREIDGPVKFDNRYGRKKAPQINLSSPFAFFSILSEMLKTPEKSTKEAVAVIYVEGAIVSGHSQPTMFGTSGGAFSGDIRKALEIAAKDERVKVVVMRVDSPGGSAEASEVILNATKQVQIQKPLIVSMGDVAASGGYYISCGADAIFADAATITASIGVVGGKLITTDLWDKLGINWIGHQRGANADIFNSIRPWDDSQRKLIETYMKDVYEVFKGHVDKGRGDKLAKPLDEMAGGRVYTGKQALDLGLVDSIGGLQEAIEYAAAKVSLSDYDVRVIPEPKDFITELMGQYSGEGERPTDVTVANGMQLLSSHPTLSPLLELLQKAEPQRARAVRQALHRIELIRQEGVIMMMPFDLVMH